MLGHGAISTAEVIDFQERLLRAAYEWVSPIMAAKSGARQV